MTSLRILALSGLALILSVFLAGCGGGSSKPVTPVGDPTITSTQLTAGTVNTAYTFVLLATGGSGTYTWSISAGSLPPGLTLNSQTATISGTPTAAGTFSFTAKVTDGAGRVGTANLSITINGAILISCNSCISGSTTLPSGNPGVPYGPETLSASGGVGPYTWCVVESNGTCDAGNGGALPPGLTISTDSNGNGIISGTPTTPGTPTTFTVQATDSETPASRGTASLTITIFSIATTSLPNGTANTSYDQNIVAVGGIPNYTWSVASGSLPPGLALDTVTCHNARTPVCKLLGIPTQTGTFSFTLQVTDGETPPATATEALSITIGARITNGALTGNYAFTANGYKNGNPYMMAGAVVMDGQGNITSGFLDLNDGSGETVSNNRVTPQTISTGSVYNLGDNGLGTMTLVTNVGTYDFNVVLASATACTPSASLSTCGRLIQSDSHMYGSGVLKVQDPTYFALSKFFPANLSFSYWGTDPNGLRYAGAGALGTNANTLVDIDCSSSSGGNGWNLDGCPSDASYASNPGLFANTIKGTFSSTIDPTTGRGNFAKLSFALDPNGYCLGTNGSPACTYVFYIVNKQEIILLSTDPISKPANLTLWTTYRQQSSATGWSANSLKGTNVVELNGVDTNGGNHLADVSAGLFVGDGAGNATFNSDENKGGTLSQPQSPQGAYAVDSTDNGQKSGKFDLSNFTQFGANGAALYMASPDALNGGNGTGLGFIISSDADVQGGLMEQQSVGPFSDGSVAGGYGGGTSQPVVVTTTNSATFLFADGAGNINASQDTSGQGGGGTDNLTLTYSINSIGRGVVQNGGQGFGILYVISPTKFVLLPDDSAPALNVFTSAPANN